MREHDAVAALIERLVARARIPRRAARDELRRELWTHFEEAGSSPQALDDALRRFGSEALITEQWRRVYRWEYAALYLAKVAASIVASAGVALLIEAVVNLRVEPANALWRLRPGFSYAATLAIAVVLGLVSAWEAVRPPFARARAAIALAAYASVWIAIQLSVAEAGRMFQMAALLVVLGLWCSRLRRPAARLLLIVAVFAAVEYGMHAFVHINFAARQALVVGVVLAAVWASTVAILARVDRAFVNRFDPAPPPAL